YASFGISNFDHDVQNVLVIGEQGSFVPPGQPAIWNNLAGRYLTDEEISDLLYTTYWGDSGQISASAESWIVAWRDVRETELGWPNSSDVGKRFRATHDYASRYGFAGGFPNFYEATYPDTGLVYGTILVKVEGAEWRDVSAAELGHPDPNDVGQFFRAVNDYAAANGFIGGFPNFHMITEPDRGVVYGVVLLNGEAAEWRDVSAAELGYPDPSDVGQRFRAAQDYASRNGFTGGFPNFYEAQYPDTGLVYGTILLKAAP
ncbi:MAG: hypothetical protein JW910_08145, partial [Anaerolineae bacterium]|nr:hypothetical protein [Anaerolineae bacterium]